MYGCESWTIKKAWCWKIDAFELWCWRRLLDCKEIQPFHPKGNQSWIFIGRTDAEAETPIFWPPDVRNWLIEKDPDPGKDWCWSWNSNTLATWFEELTHWKRPWFGDRLKAGGEGDDRGWDGWMASPTQWTWVWVNSGSWWWTGRPVMLQSMGSQRVGHDWATELNWPETYT